MCEEWIENKVDETSIIVQDVVRRTTVEDRLLLARTVDKTRLHCEQARVIRRRISRIDTPQGIKADNPFLQVLESTVVEWPR